MKKMVCLALVLCLIPLLAPGETRESINWYEIFVCSFSDSNGDGIGDLKGVQNKLDYIEGMGYDGLWLMPVMPSPSYHKYDVTDYYGIDPLYGSPEDMRQLVAACHERGIRIIVDLPVNHSSTRHPWFTAAVEALKNGRPDHPMVAYYRFSKEGGDNMVPVSGTEWFYEEQFKGGGMPDLNLDHEPLREEIKNILEAWLIGYGVDGFRLDAVTSFYTKDDAKNIEFLRFLKESAEAIKPGSFLVGEAWTGLPTIARYYESGIDSFFLFPASQAEGYVAAAMRARRPAETFLSHLERVEAAIPQGILTPFLSNHDTGRTVGLVQGRQAPARVKFAHALLSLFGGYTFTYYGEEIGMAGSGADPNKRLGLLWQEGELTSPPPGVTGGEYPFPGVLAQEADPLSILNYLKQLNHLRLEHPGLALGTFTAQALSPDTLKMTREYRGESLTILVNFSAKEGREISLEGTFISLGILDTAEAASAIEQQGGQTIISLQPFGLMVLKEERP